MGHWRASKGMGMCDTWIGGLEKLTGELNQSKRESPCQTFIHLFL